MEAEIVLILGMILLAGGCLSTLVVRLCSPSLKGMDWFSGAFASGALAAALYLLGRHQFVPVLGADLAILTSFLLLHRAVLELTKEAQWQRWIGPILICVQTAVDRLRFSGVLDGHGRLISMGLLLAFQTGVTATVLLQLSRKKVRYPARYSAVLMLAFALFNAVRSALLLGGLHDQALTERLGIADFTLFMAVALGMAFGFFWMTTASLTEEVEHIASTDPLTRVYNRRVFLKWCEKELLRTQRSGVPFSLLMVDLDYFKQVNDNFGHTRGDEVLCAAVERIQDSVRGIDVLCRWGGEEFAVLLPNAPREATSIVAERIRMNIQRLAIPLTRTPQEPVAELTASIGAATYRDLDDDIGAMLLRADRALYRAKSGGRNQVLIGG